MDARNYRQSQRRTAYREAPRKRKPFKLFSLVILILVILVAAYGFSRDSNVQSSDNPLKTQTSKSTPPIKTVTVNPCANNNLSQLILVSINQRHLWACDTTSVVYQSAVVTGIEYLPADLTPPGTYHIYAKETDTYLKGCDSTGCWNDYVNYWMPFLDNQYGAYGIHDATWRASNAFGNIDPNSSSASHGCVETPLATAQWLYDWATIGTTVTVQQA